MSSEHNPYRPPASAGREHLPSDPVDEQGFILATRGSRFSAAMLDGLLLLLVFMPLMSVTGALEDIRTGGLSLDKQLLWSAVSFSVWLLLNGYFLHTRGQSLGKIVMKIKILRHDGRSADLFRLAFLRMLPMQLAALVPIVGSLINLVDALFIFGAEQRCIHDLIADTKVVRAPGR